MKEITVTFDELVQHGLETTGPSSLSETGMPWSFEFHGLPVTHENDDCYLVGPAGDDRIIVERGGSFTMPVQEIPEGGSEAVVVQEIATTEAPIAIVVDEPFGRSPMEDEIENAEEVGAVALKAVDSLSLADIRLADSPAHPSLLGSEGPESDDEIVAQASDIPVELVSGAFGAVQIPEGFVAELPEDGVEELEPISSRTLAEHIESAPATIELPELKLPVGAVIEKTPNGFLFKIASDRPTYVGKGRTIYGAMLDAGLIK